MLWTSNRSKNKWTNSNQFNYNFLKGNGVITYENHSQALKTGVNCKKKLISLFDLLKVLFEKLESHASRPVKTFLTPTIAQYNTFFQSSLAWL